MGCEVVITGSVGVFSIAVWDSVAVVVGVAAVAESCTVSAIQLEDELVEMLTEPF